MMGHRVNVTMYSVLEDEVYIRQALLEKFRQIAKEVTQKKSDEHDVITVRLQDESMVMLYLSKDEGLLKHHQETLRRMFDQVECSQALKRQVLEQLTKFCCICGCIFESSSHKQKINAVLEVLFETAQLTHSFLLLPPMNLYNQQGQLILNKNGESEVEKLDIVDPEQERLYRSMEILKQHSLSLKQHKAMVKKQEVQMRSTEEIVYRIGALYAVCVYSEVMRNCLKNYGSHRFLKQLKLELGDDYDKEFREDAWVYIHQMNAKFKGKLHQHFTKDELAFLNVKHPRMHQLNQFCSQFEACAVLLWSLGLIPALPYPDTPCNMAKLASVMWHMNNVDTWIAETKRRTKKELLDEAELHAQFETVCSSSSKRRARGTLHPAVVKERHIAFQWLLGVDSSKGWDEIRSHHHM